jgi:acyl-CoA reductase-like NAD-dependent aldehyde dehydrogenase
VKLCRSASQRHDSQGRSCRQHSFADDAAQLFLCAKQSGFGRETHKLALGHYQQTKNLLVSYSPKPLGFF